MIAMLVSDYDCDNVGEFWELVHKFNRVTNNFLAIFVNDYPRMFEFCDLHILFPSFTILASFNFFDLVAQGGSELKIEVSSGQLHLRLKLFDKAG